MNGVAVIRQLLAGDAALTALVPAEKIVTGVLAQGTRPPAISISEVSSVDRNILAPGATRHVTDRVQVTGIEAAAGDAGNQYPRLRQIMAAVKRAAADKMPPVAGIGNVVVHTDGAGPDLRDDEAALLMRSQDFKVSYTQAR